MPPDARRLEISAIAKAFGATVALRGVSLTAARAEIHAVIGENGAGKSTLMGILSGAVAADSGSVLLDGEPFAPPDPRLARAAGVAMVHQELSLCRHLSVAENIVLGDEPASVGVVRAGEMERRATAALERVLGDGVKARFPLRVQVGSLSPADQQIVEIARAVAAPRCRVLILDEPTSSLAGDDTERLFALLRKLRGEGLTILYISHFLDEVQRIADRFTVLRDGASVASGGVAEVRVDDLVTMMAGRAVKELYPRAPRTPGEVLLEVKDLRGEGSPAGASLEVRRGEILGVAGLVGAGRTELLRAIFGLDAVRAGTVRVGAFTTRHPEPHVLLSRGAGMLSEDRKGEGLALALSVADNITLSRLEGLGPAFVVLPSRKREAARALVAELGVRCASVDDAVSKLSGGNQQKVALARLLHCDVDVLLLDEPVRGIDVGSKAQIYGLVGRLAARGKAIVIVSSYLPELFGVCDRIAVMSRGRLGAARAVSEWTEQRVLAEAAGVEARA